MSHDKWPDFEAAHNARIDALYAENERLRKGYEDIKAAAVAGRVCDDVAWFDTITTLYDFCEIMLHGGLQQTVPSGEKP